MTAVETTQPSATLPSGAPQSTVEHQSSVAAIIGRQVLRSAVILVISLAVLLVVWWGVFQIVHMNPQVSRTPGDIWSYFFNAHPKLGLRPPDVWQNPVSAGKARSTALDALGVTLEDAALGFVVGMVVALVISALFVLFPPFEFAFMPVAMLLRSVPLIAMAPVILLIFNQGKLSITLIGTVVVLFPALINSVLGLRSAPLQTLDVIRVNGGGRWAALLRVQLPTALPNIFAAIRISVPGAMVGAMLGEWLVGFDGLGGKIPSAAKNSDPSQVWALAMIAVVVSFVLYSIVTIIETAVLAQWGPDAGKV